MFEQGRQPEPWFLCFLCSLACRQRTPLLSGVRFILPAAFWFQLCFNVAADERSLQLVFGALWAVLHIKTLASLVFFPSIWLLYLEFWVAFAQLFSIFPTSSANITFSSRLRLRVLCFPRDWLSVKRRGRRRNVPFPLDFQFVKFSLALVELFSFPIRPWWL